MFQQTLLVGNLGSDPTLRYTPSGAPVCSFSVATSHEYTKDGQKVKETLWFRVTTWGKQAEICAQYLHKGSKVLVEGRLTGDQNGNPRTYQRQDGTTGSSFEITASTVRFLSQRGEGSEDAAVEHDVLQDLF